MSNILFPTDTTGVTPATWDIILIADVSDSNNPKDCTLAELPVSTATQTALDAKQDTLTGLTASVAELNYTDWVTSAIQTQIDSKSPIASPTFTGTVTVPTPSNGTDASNKDYSDTLNPDFYQYSIVRSVGNLIVNNSFETDLSWWSGWLSSSFSRVTSQSFSGTASAQVVTDGSTYAQWCYYYTIPTKIWFNYTYSCYVKWTAWKQITMFIDWWTNPEYYQTLTWWWDRITWSVTATTTNTAMYIQCRTAWVTTYWVDAAQVEEWTTTAWPFTTIQGNLTVALKNYEGNDPTSTKPVKIMIGGVLRTITSALSVIRNSWTNWYNAGSTELATEEIDFFTYIRWNTNGAWYAELLPARVPSFNLFSDSSGTTTYTNEKYLSDTNWWSSTDPVTNIWRFNATLSAGWAYTWSIPATSVIVNSPIYENQKQKNQLIVGEWINQSASYTTSVTMDFSSFTEYDITAQAWALLFNNPSGTPVNGQKRMVRIKDNWTARALTYWSQFASGSATLLTTTVISKKSWMGFEWDSTDSKWYLLATWTQP